MDSTEAPKWRVPPERTGPLEADKDPWWLTWLWNWSTVGCVAMSAAVIAAAAVTWWLT